jgi:hypothetical protein
MHNLEQEIVDRARNYALNGKDRYFGTTNKYDEWLDKIHQRFTEVLLPTIFKAEEQFIDYWPAQFLWDESTEEKHSLFSALTSQLPDTILHGTLGTGYLCVTDINSYIIVYTQLSKKFPLFNPSGMSKDKRRPTNNDTSWRIPYETILDVRKSTNSYNQSYIQLDTASTTWKIYHHFAGHLDSMITAFHMGVNGATRKSTFSQNGWIKREKR